MTFLPLFHARSIPGGPVSRDCYQAFKSAFLAELGGKLPVDGVLLIMHGAMHVPDLDDVEGDWIESVRQLVGKDIPIAVSYDLHGNVTQKIIDQIDIFCAYRTAPHIDVRSTHLRAAGLLSDQVRHGTRHYVGWAPVPVLHPGEKTSTEDEPAKSLYLQLAEHDALQGVSDANIMVGYVWADTARATAAAVVTGTDPEAIQQSAAKIAQSYWDNRNHFAFGVPTKPLNACLDDAEATSKFPFILADSGDNPTGGGVGDRTDVLRAWLERKMHGGVFAGIADPKAVKTAWVVPEGQRVELSIGGAFGSNCPLVRTEATTLLKRGSVDHGDREVLLDIEGNHVILTERRRPFHNIADFKAFGIDPRTVEYLIVKSGYLSPELAPLANPARMALTEGAVNQNITALTNHNRPLPSYPFQDDFFWQADAKLSARVLLT